MEVDLFKVASWICFAMTLNYSISSPAKILDTRITWSNVKVFSASIDHICDLTMAHKNYVGKLREAFIMASEEVAIHEGSRPYSAICATTRLIKLALWLRSLISALSLVCPNQRSYSAVDLGARNSGPNNYSEWLSKKYPPISPSI